ncbi:M23 family metallopeptidase [Microbacterium oleivorans]|uniref:M23 family metallopeptidase n=1 Tax=Microbacterium oleivorans TaxID=273677 RepID=A0A7D5JXC8_9MICO|nr:M23 family metallopeptidase [Microbacterium oleivorans]QLD10883.1 M23 family metallopeptidase [Microbacterium oleivorans]
MTKMLAPAPHGRFVRGWVPGSHRGRDDGWRNHDPEGTKHVQAVVEGVIVATSKGGHYNGGWGNQFIVDHGHGIFTSYNHFRTGSMIGKGVGDRVAAGEFLGRMGSTGAATGDHSHFEVRVGGSGEQFRVDPAPWLNGSKEIPGGQPASGGLARQQRRVRANVGTEGYLNGRLSPTVGDNVRQRLASNVVGNFDGFIRGQEVTVDGVTSNIWFRGAFNGNFFAAAGFTSQSTDGLTDLGGSAAPAPAPIDVRLFAFLSEAWYVFPSAEAAVNAPRGHRGPTVGPGEFYVHEIRHGAYRIDAGWLHPKAGAHVRRRG